MLTQRRPWQEELAIIDQTMKAISGVLDPEELIRIYWNGIGQLVPVDDYVALSRRCIARIRCEVTAFTENMPPTDDRTLIAIRCK